MGADRKRRRLASLLVLDLVHAPGELQLIQAFAAEQAKMCKCPTCARRTMSHVPVQQEALCLC